MAKGRILLKTAGVLMLVFGLLQVLFAIFFGLVGAAQFNLKETVSVGLLVFFGILGILTGFIVMGSGASAYRNAENHRYIKCIVCGIISLILGVCCLITLIHITSLTDAKIGPVPTWVGMVSIIAGGIVMPLCMIGGGVLNKISSSR